MTKNWYPLIDYKKCSQCLTCVKFCKHDVYVTEGGKPKIIKPENCVEFCHGCGNMCPEKAIKYFGDKNKKQEKRKANAEASNKCECKPCKC